MGNIRTYCKDMIRTALYKAADTFVNFLFGDDDPSSMKPERTQ